MLTDEDVYIPPDNPVWDYVLYGLNLVVALWEIFVIIQCIRGV